jgi:hypothetical protein
MKIYLKRLVSILVLISGSLLLNSCHPFEHDGCEDKNTYREYSISKNTIDQIPYRKDGLDTLVYISTDGDTAILYGKGVRKRYLNCKVDESPNPDCSNNTNYKIQAIDYNYTGDQLNFKQLVYYVYNNVSSKIDEDEVTNYSATLYYDIGFMPEPFGPRVQDYRINTINDSNSIDGWVTVDNVTLYGKRMYSNADSIIVLHNKNYGAIEVQTGGKTWIKKF